MLGWLFGMYTCYDCWCRRAGHIAMWLRFMQGVSGFQRIRCWATNKKTAKRIDRKTHRPHRPHRPQDSLAWQPLPQNYSWQVCQRACLIRGPNRGSRTHSGRIYLPHEEGSLDGEPNLETFLCKTPGGGGTGDCFFQSSITLTRDIK